MERFTIEDIAKSFQSDHFAVPLAPPYGLTLAQTMYPNYNKRNSHKPVEMNPEEESEARAFFEASILPTMHTHFQEFSNWAALEFRST